MAPVAVPGTGDVLGLLAPGSATHVVLTASPGAELGSGVSRTLSKTSTQQAKFGVFAPEAEEGEVGKGRGAPGRWQPAALPAEPDSDR